MPGKGRPFTKGNKFGKGRPPKPKEIRDALALAKSQVEKRLIQLLAMTRADLTAILQNPDSQMIDITLAAIITKAAQKGDNVRLNFIFDRLIGKVKEVNVIEIPEGDGATLVGVAYVPRSKRDK